MILFKNTSSEDGHRHCMVWYGMKIRLRGYSFISWCKIDISRHNLPSFDTNQNSWIVMQELGWYKTKIKSCNSCKTKIKILHRVTTKGGVERFLVYIISYHAQWNVANYVTSFEEIMVEYESKLGLFNDIYCPWFGRFK